MDPSYVCVVLAANRGGRFDPVAVCGVRVPDGGGGVVGSAGGIACSEDLVGELALFASLGAGFFCWGLSGGCADWLSRQLVPCWRLVPVAVLGLVVPPPEAGRFFHQTVVVKSAATDGRPSCGGDVVVTAGQVVAATDASGVSRQGNGLGVVAEQQRPAAAGRIGALRSNADRRPTAGSGTPL